MRLRFHWLATAALLLISLGARAADAKINVVTTIPDLADMARNIAGDLAEVKSISTGVEDIHAVPMKPSFAVLLNRADILFLMGLEMEHAFLPGLLDAARNPKVMRDAPGYIDCSMYVTPLEVPTRLDRSLGDQHPMGNPHFNLDPVRAKEMARAVEFGFESNYPDNASTWKANLDAYLAKLDAAIARWKTEAAPLRGVKLVSYHPDMIYLSERYGMDQIGTIEIRAGIDPTPSHIAELEEKMRREHDDLVVRELHYPAGLAETLAQKTNAKLVELPVMVGGVPQAKTYIELMDYMIHTLVAAVQGKK